MRALLHVHSNYSYDGVPTLEDLAGWGEARGLDLIFLSEHANDFDAPKMLRLVTHCEALASPKCRIVPGLEFPVRGGFHLLGYNLRSFEPISDLGEAARFIREQDGLAVLAHPQRYSGRWPEAPALAELDGIEAWNARYDGRFFPSGTVLAESARHARASGRMCLFGGQDLHAVTSSRLVVTAQPAAKSTEQFITGLRNGEATFGASPFALPSRGDVGAAVLTTASLLHAGYRGARRLRDRLTGRPGIRPRSTRP